MGSGWIDLQRNHPQIVNMALRAAELTVALDQAVRGGNGCLTLGQMSLLAFVFQYDLCNLNPDMKNLLLAAGSSPWDQLSMICLFGLQIYSDVVLFPNAEFYGIRPRLARWLQAALTAHRLTEDSSTDLSYWEVILWATVMGAVAAEGTRHRHWYLFQLSTIMVDRELSWESLQDHLRRFLWWDYTFDERLSKIWEDARAVAITGNKGGGPVISDK
ncbi:hypothetical protein H2200_000624 [Cladophialophora chaetospira]|uniref:Uncharacterized protein n=1 Tax=Cladophialophora chaetospira TaxID=386627 RepID=A0AA38XPU5_9EURO|nr:hypothetical protein H2200_000624 [Cladophialophora chaetospira]